MIEYTVRIDEDGNRSWWFNSQLHREGGPAVEYADGTKYWYLNGKLHRIDGPAIEYTDRNRSWWLNGQRYQTEADYLLALKSDNCAGKTVVIDGRTCILTLKED